MASTALTILMSKDWQKRQRNSAKKEARQNRRKEKQITLDKKKTEIKKGTDPKKWDRQDLKVFLQYETRKTDSKMSSALAEVQQQCRDFKHWMLLDTSLLPFNDEVDDREINVKTPETEIDAHPNFAMSKVYQ